MQPVDFTTLAAVRAELCQNWIPARMEQVYQRDRHTISLALRTLKQRDWLTISWHPQAARVCIGDPPPPYRDTFTFSDQLRHQLNGYALIAIEAIAPWERVLDFQFAKRPGEQPNWHLYLEIMGKYSNVILTDAQNQIITVAHQVTAAKSSLRTVETGQLYQLPPPLTGSFPKLKESQESWQERVSLIPGKIKRQLLQSYLGLSPALVKSMLVAAEIDPDLSTALMTESDWAKLFQLWQEWLKALENSNFHPCWNESGYSVLGWGSCPNPEKLQTILNPYYTGQLNREVFQQLRHQLKQRLNRLLGKLNLKADTFKQRLQQSDGAEVYREKADLLMAHLHHWQPGMTSITLADFLTDKPVEIALNPEKNGVQNAQAFYKQHQKLKRARTAVEPLLQQVEEEKAYLEQVEESLERLQSYKEGEDLQALEEIREELIQQGYLELKAKRSSSRKEESQPHRYITPSGFQLWIGRNNSQNDRLTFRIANDYDLWFHTQEIPGSHVLLRLEPGSIAHELDLQYAANLTAYYSRGRESESVPVVYTRPKYVYKPKGAKPGMAIYQREKILWGRPQEASGYLIQKQ